MSCLVRSGVRDITSILPPRCRRKTASDTCTNVHTGSFSTAAATASPPPPSSSNTDTSTTSPVGATSTTSIPVTRQPAARIRIVRLPPGGTCGMTGGSTVGGWAGKAI